MNRPADDQQTLRSGGLTGHLIGQDLRRLRWDGEEFLNRLYLAVRDRHWATLPGEVRVTHRDDARLEWTADYRLDTGSLVVQASLQLEPDALSCRMTATAAQRVEYNRIGWCLLLPLTFAGAPIAFVDSTDATQTTRLPDLVAPQPLGPTGPEPAIGPFRQFEFRGEQAGYRLIAQGDLFELEDQRNWTDASFKIYSTPLATPRLLVLEAGRTLHQEVRLTRDVTHPTIPVPAETRRHRDTASSTSDGLRLTEPRGTSPSPRLSALLSEPSPADLSGLRSLGIGLARIELRPSSPADLARASILLQQAKDAALDTELTLWCDPETPWRDVAGLVARYRPELVLVLHADAQSGQAHESTSPELISLALSMLPGTTVGGGTPFNLCELQRQPMSHLPVLACSFTPTVHATDELSILETPDALADVVRTLRARAPHADLALGPFQGQERRPGDPPPSIAGLPPEWLARSLAEVTSAGVERLCVADLRDLIQDAAPTAHGKKVAEHLAKAVG